ncbi:MAG: NUDIX domain-containing protein [Sphingomonadales bacterium]|nr:NUDIX domain-containing protein [Sphingomonadales bacterium]MDE2170532.1 NUDIX domain-containing protein [Sphingomonadales bacterium]
MSAPLDPPRPAATLIIFRQPKGEQAQVLMLVRGSTMRFAGGACVFPGGGVDEADRQLAATLPAPTGWDGHDDMAARIAAIRETLEETGLAIGLTRRDGRRIGADDAAEARAMLTRSLALAPVLGHMGWALDAAALTPFARWCPRLPRPYDTRFYLADLGTGAVALAPDAGESESLLWVTPGQALDQADAGDLSLLFPTRRNLERLAQFSGFGETRRHALATPLDTITPRIIERDGQSWLTFPTGLGYPVVEQPLDQARRQ